MEAGQAPGRSERGGSGSWPTPVRGEGAGLAPVRSERGEVEAGLAPVRSERGRSWPRPCQIRKRGKWKLA